MPHYWTVLPVFTKVAAKKRNLSASEISRVDLVPQFLMSTKNRQAEKGFCV